jgi:hypothetical protein
MINSRWIANAPVRSFALLLAGTLCLAGGAVTAAQDRPSYSRMLNIDALIDNHARFLARRYNLSDEQDQYTQALLKQKADQFLARHREELYDLIDRVVEVRAGGEIDTTELIAWGQRALPLYEEAKAMIVTGNDEWRAILSEEQRKVHDDDLREMYTSFSTTEDQLQRIISGQMTSEEFRRGPGRQVPAVTGPAQVPQAHTPTPATPTPQPGMPPGHVARRPGTRPPGADSAGSDPSIPGRPQRPVRPGTASGPANFESQWEAYVREFIQKYKLDSAQIERANALLKDCQEQANRIVAKRKPEMDRIEEKLKELAASTEPEKQKELKELNERKQKMLEPINEIFEKTLKPKLERLPTRAQRQAAESSPSVPGSTPPGKESAGQPPRTRPPRPQPPENPPPAPEPEDPVNDEPAEIPDDSAPE